MNAIPTGDWEGGDDFFVIVIKGSFSQEDLLNL